MPPKSDPKSTLGPQISPKYMQIRFFGASYDFWKPPGLPRTSQNGAKITKKRKKTLKKAVFETYAFLDVLVSRFFFILASKNDQNQIIR